MSSSSVPIILCAGIAVQDIVFRVEQFPPPGGKCMTNEFLVVSGGCAVNAAIAVARLGGRARYAGPLGDLTDNVSNQLMAEMAREGIDTAGVVRVAGATAPVSGIMVDAAGERMIVTHRDKRIETARLADPDRLVADISLLLADNRFPELVRPVCEAARRRGIPIVLDADRPTVEDDPLFRIPTHVIFSGECLRATTGLDDLSAGLQRMAPRTEAFLAVSDGPGPVRYLARCGSHHAGVQVRSDRHAGGRRRVPRRHRAGAGGRPRCGRGDAVRRRGGRPQMHALRRQHGRAEARRGRRVSGKAG